VPRMAESIEYSPLAASDPNWKFVSKVTSKRDSVEGNGSPEVMGQGAVGVNDTI
jgi:hypothetical protein